MKYADLIEISGKLKASIFRRCRCATVRDKRQARALCPETLDGVNRAVNKAQSFISEISK